MEKKKKDIFGRIDMCGVSSFTTKLFVHTFQTILISCFWIIPLHPLTKRRKALEVLVWAARNGLLSIRTEPKFSSYCTMIEDGYERISGIGIPLKVAQRITVKERVNIHVMSYLLEDVVQNKDTGNCGSEDHKGLIESDCKSI